MKIKILAIILILIILSACGNINRQGRIKDRIIDKNTDSSIINEPITQDKTGCSKPFNVGYMILELQESNKKFITAVWYPTNDDMSSYSYGSGGAVGENAFDGEPLNCGPFPLIVFSHGFGGCGVQTVFFTEELARQGYVVVAPDHKDAGCSIYPDGEQLGEFSLGGFRNPELWDDSYYENRKEDVKLVIDEMLKLNSQADSVFHGTLDENKIGMSGHSLGGYTAFGVVGGWDSWKDNRIKVALMFSPFIQPFLEKSTLSDVNVPVMYQGGNLDIGITPYIEGENGAYAQSNPPKFFLKLNGAGHMAWTNTACRRYSTIPQCAESNTNVKLINDYGIAFLDKYLKNEPSPQLLKKEPFLESYEYLL